MTALDILSKIQGVKKTNDGWLGLCPSHADEHRSLSIAEKNGRILLKCFAGCETEDIVASLGLSMKGLFNDSEQPEPRSIPKNKRIDAVYDYTDEKGNLLFQSVRYDPKGFSQRKPNGLGGFDYHLNGTRRVLYHLPEVLAVESVLIVEGEKDVEAIRERGCVATCNPAGALKWRDEYSEALRNKTAVILPDNDEPGRKHAQQVANSLYGIAKEIFVIELPNLKPKGDVSDFFASGGTIEDIDAMVEKATCWQPLDANDTEARDFEETEMRPFPVPNEKCFHGLAGEFVRMIEPQTEASNAALLVQFLTYAGNIIGRSAYYQVEADKHFTNLFCVLVGDTASGRKGTSFGRVKEIFKGEDDAHEKNGIVSGLASGEGLLYQIRDAIWEEKTDKKTKRIEATCIDNGVSDKRLLIVEGEFAQVLRVQGREGNTLSAFLRNLWDNGTARNLTKNSPLRTTDAHVSIIGHITKTELLNCLNEVEAANGYANRFLWFAVRRSKFLPFGAPGIDDCDRVNFQRKLSNSVEFARSVERMVLTTEARDLFATVYKRLETSRYGFLAKITQRATAYVCRLSCVFALLDCKDEIDREHLEAALAVWQYAEDSARYIFGGRLSDKNAETILDALRESSNGLNRTEIRNLFDRHLSKQKIDAALQSLLENGLAKCRREETKGRAKEIWKACDISDKSDLSSENPSCERPFVAFVAKNASETNADKVASDVRPGT